MEKDPDFIRKKLKLNPDGTPRDKVKLRKATFLTIISGAQGHQDGFNSKA